MGWFFSDTKKAAKKGAAAAEDAADAAEDAVEVMEHQGGQFNDTARRGVEQAEQMNETAEDALDVMEHQGEQLNETANRGVEQAEQLNQTAENGIGMMNDQAEQINETADRGVDVMEEQAEQLNETAAHGVGVMEEQAINGIDMVNQQAGDLNMTADKAVEEWGRAIDSFEGTSEVVANAIDLWSPSIDLFLSILGPLQMIAGFQYFTLILKNLGLTRAVPESIQQLDVTNTILQDMADTYREVETIGVVRQITSSSIVKDESTKKLTAHFFYTQNNLIVQQMRGSDAKYFAYDSISDLLKAVYCWNAFLHAADCEDVPNYTAIPEQPKMSKDGKDNLTPFGNRCTKIYFLDPAPKHIVLPILELHDIYKEVIFINHCRAKDRLKLESVKIHEGCFARFEHLTICEIDGAHTGRAHLYKCDIGWDPVESEGNMKVTECKKTKFPGKWRRILAAVGGVVFLLLAAFGIFVWFHGPLRPRVAPSTPPPTPLPTAPPSTSPTTSPTSFPSLAPTIQTCETMCGSLRKTHNAVRVGGTALRAAVLEYLNDPSSSPYGPIINCWDVSPVSPPR